MTSLCCDVLKALEGKTLATAESCTGGMIGAMLTSVSGASKVYKGGIISYWSEVKQNLLNVDAEDLKNPGPVSMQVAASMAEGARKALHADIGISVTGLAGPGSDDRGNPVGTVYLGYADGKRAEACQFRFDGSRDQVREQAVRAALELILQNNP